MIADRTMTGNRVKVNPLWWNAALFLAFFAVTVLLQFLSGAYRSEFGGYPDESAHYVTSLMVRDFIAGLHYTEPMNFARNYYAHYPKVAFGHWPPLLYVIGGVWMLVFSPSRFSVLLQLAFITSLLAWLTYAAVKRHFGTAAGCGAGFFLICLPITQVYSDEIMAESLLALVSFAAVLFFVRYLDSQRWQDNAMFGVFAALAILTKGSGWDLALVPPIALLLTRDFRPIRRYSFWLSGLIVFVICAPWQILTLSSVQRGWQGGDHPSFAYTWQAAGELLSIMFSLLGWALAPIVVLGMAVTVMVPFFKNRAQASWAAMAALILADWFFHAIVPAGVEDRKLIIAVPALILFLLAGSEWIANKLKWSPSAVMIGVFAIFAFQKFTIPKQIHYGYREAAGYIREHPDPQRQSILVSSERDGEGMFISEVAMSEHRPNHYILRGTKVLADSDWNGKVSESYYRSPESLIVYLRRAKIGLVVSDTLAPVLSFEHQRVLNQTIAKYPDYLQLIASFHGDLQGAINIYRVN